MSFLKRLLYYLFGFSIGLIFLFYFMNKKEATFNYSPNKRVLADIDKKKWIFQSKFDSLEIIKEKLIENYYVDFSQSNVEVDSCKTYVLKKNSKKEIYYYNVINCLKIAKFQKIYY